MVGLRAIVLALAALLASPAFSETCTQILTEKGVFESCRDEAGDLAIRGPGGGGGRDTSGALAPVGRLVLRSTNTLGATNYREALTLMDRAALKRGWSGPFKLNGVGSGLAAAVMFANSDIFPLAVAVGALIGSVVATVIGILLDFSARSDVSEAIRILGG